MNMATLHKITLSTRELSDLRKIQDNFVAEKAAIEQRLGEQLMAFWKEVRLEHNLEESPFHVMGKDLWILRDATKEEAEAFITMTKYK